jgi:hypothetical protein
LRERGKEERARLELQRTSLDMREAALRLEASQRQAALPTDRLWTEKQAAAYLGMSERWMRDSDVPKVLLPGKGTARAAAVRYESDEVKAYARAKLTHTITREG